MTKDDVLFAVVGIVAGLVLGFLVANSKSVNQAPVQAGRSDSASVNGGGPELPANHPPVPGGGDESGSLPLNHPDISGQPGAQTSSADASAPIDLPSLDPLPASSKDLKADQKYKNIQVLKGVPASRWMSIMMAFKQSLGVDCTFCHVKDEWDSDDKQTKQIARKMIKMVIDDNNQLGGIGRVSCFTCHRGHERPAS